MTYPALWKFQGIAYLGSRYKIGAIDGRLLQGIPYSQRSYKEKQGGNDPSLPDSFYRPIFILPLCQSRHTTSSLGQFLFYRRVGTVTRLQGEATLTTSHYNGTAKNVKFNRSIQNKILLVGEGRKQFDKIAIAPYNECARFSRCILTTKSSILCVGGVDMATSSITKEFYVKDQAAFERLKKELSVQTTPRKKVVESPSLKKGREKLATFVFR